MASRNSLTLRVYKKLERKRIGPARRAKLLVRLLREFKGDSAELRNTLGAKPETISRVFKRGNLPTEKLVPLKLKLKEEHILRITKEKQLTKITAVSRETDIPRETIYYFLRIDPAFKEKFHQLLKEIKVQNKLLKRQKREQRKRKEDWLLKIAREGGLTTITSVERRANLKKGIIGYLLKTDTEFNKQFWAILNENYQKRKEK